MDSENKWVDDVRNWVWTFIVSKIKTNDQIKQKYVDTVRTPTWLKAFTHETADTSQNNTNNYEKLEFGGDGFLYALGREFFIGKYPEMSVSQLTEMASYYVNGKVQSELLLGKMDPSSIVKLGPGYTMKKYNIGSDIFESIFGALYYCANSIQPGTGYAACSNLFTFFYADYPFDITKSFGVPKNQIIKILTRFPTTKIGGKDGLPIEKKRVVEGGAAEIWVYLSQPHYNILERGSRRIPDSDKPRDNIIGYGNSGNVDDSSDAAYKQALKWLNDRNINVSWSDLVKSALEREHPEVKPWYHAFKQRLDSEGFIDYDISKAQKMSTKTRPVYMLKGKRPDGTMKYLIGVEGSLRTIDAIAELFKMYGQNEKELFKVIYSKPNQTTR